jgi:hypothetical protein
MRSLPVLVMLAVFLAPLQACGGTRASGPAWPKLTDPEIDGGESLAPRKGAGVVALDTSESEEPAAPDAASTPAKPAGADAGAPAATTPEAPAAATPEDDEELVITTEEIIIEIEEE